MKKEKKIYKKYIKRVIDFVLCLFAIVILSPVFLFAALGIKLSSKGPVFYHSKRTGKSGKIFNFYKFRSMHLTDADKGLFVADPDRTFKFGRFIRKTKIDELPQLVNVIKGDMSIVGPRPMPLNSDMYTGKYEIITSVKPGLTSPASLYDYIIGDQYTDDEAYMKEVFPKKRELELLYIKKEAFIYDASLVGRTILIIIQVIFGKKKFDILPELESIREKV